MADRRPLRKNTLTYLGATVMLVAFAFGVILIVSELVFQNHNPYSAVVTYIVIPSIIGLGALIALGGVARQYRRRRKKLERSDRDDAAVLPVIDFNRPKTRRRAALLAGGLALFFAVSAVATYRGFVFTESVEFCGTTCHQVMAPEYVAYQNSPHARVSCVECHIGHGADWYARSKISGLRQVWRTVLDSYEMPIETPIENLRPARETCQECHWPEIFTGSIERVQWHYWYDEANTPSRYHMLMHVGGASPDHGEPTGIHWHISNEHVVRYWASDRQRLEIPWVEVEHADGTREVFRSGDAPEGRPPDSEIRVMDCIDCHNRPTHIYYSPSTMMNRAISSGRIDNRLPAVKANGVELLSGNYGTYAEARERIVDYMRETYLADGASANGLTGDELTQAVETATAEMIEIYEQTHFPEQGVDWTTYPDHIGHVVSPGCYRCHAGDHASETGEVISAECSLCHDFVHQAHGEDAYGPVVYETQDFEHPDGIPDMHLGLLCTDCHAVQGEDGETE